MLIIMDTPFFRAWFFAKPLFHRYVPKTMRTETGNLCSKMHQPLVIKVKENLWLKDSRRLIGPTKTSVDHFYGEYTHLALSTHCYTAIVWSQSEFFCW